MLRPISGKRSPMNGVANLTRNAAAALVDREERRTGSRMVAYEIVAQTVGTSAEWLRKFVSSNGAKEPRVTVGFNLIQVYRRVCERVEQAADQERLLRDQIDAAFESAGLVVVRAEETASGATSLGETLEGGMK